MAKSKIDVWNHNFAENKKVRERIESLLIPSLKGVREERQPLQEEWKKFFNMWNVKHDEHHAYTGRAKLYIPEVRKNVEAQARQLVDAAFPSEEFFDCSPGEAGTKKGAQIWKSIQRWNIERSQLRVKFHPFCRQEVLYGTSPAYVSWTEKQNRIMRSARDPKTKKIKVSRDLIKAVSHPDFLVRDLMLWHTMNPKISDLSDGCFEDYLIGYFDILRRSKSGQLHDIESLFEEKSDALKMDELRDYVEKMENTGLSILSEQGLVGEYDLNEDQGLDPKLRKYLCTSVYIDMVLPEACEDDEDQELPIPLKIEIYNGNHVGFVGRNPFWHQKPPYLVGKYILPNADEFYGQGIPWAIQYMQHEINSKAEQAMDSATLALNPLAFVDPALAAQISDFNVEPGAIWFIRPDGVKLGAVPDLTNTGYAAISQLRGQMMDYSDRAPALPPQLLGKARSATQADVVDRAMSVDMKAFSNQNEIMVLQPLLEMWESLTDQNIQDDQVIMILGRRSSDWKRMLVRKSQTLGQYAYFWKASSYNANKPIMARQMLDMVKVSATLPPDAQQRLNFKYDELFKILWTEMFNLPDGDRLFGNPEEMVSQDPEVEHKMLELGLELEVLPADNDDEHIQKHMEFAKSLKDEQLQASLEYHIMMHDIQKKKKVAAMQQMIQMRQAMMQQQAMAQQSAGQRKSPGSGNRTQMNSNMNAGDMGSGVRA